MKKKIIIGSRGSDLALWQAKFVQSQLINIGISSDIKIIKTKGDKIQNLSFDKMEGKGFFTKEIEDALLNKKVDVAVHSCKDLATEKVPGLIIAGYSEREAANDILLINNNAANVKCSYLLKKNAVIGTSSARRKSQFKALRPDVTLKDLRGNVPTRIQKLQDGKYDAILLARAGIDRLKQDISGFVAVDLAPRQFVAAPAQGVLAYQIRESDTWIKEIIGKISINPLEHIVSLERDILNNMGGGCQIPLGIYCVKNNENYQAWASYASNKEKIPKLIHVQSYYKAEVVKKALNLLKAKRPALTSVFITQNINRKDVLYRYLTAYGIKLEGQSFIQFKKIKVRDVPQTDWIFFSSKNAVKYYFETVEIDKKAKFAAIGNGTATALHKYDIIPDFIGMGNHIDLTAEKLIHHVKGKSVLFPQSDISLRSIQKKVSQYCKVNDLVIYKTIPLNEISEINSDVAIFTSPSNVEAYFSKQKDIHNKFIIAAGKSTANKLKEHGYADTKIPESLHDINLVQMINSL